jgi:hypothetical protein
MHSMLLLPAVILAFASPHHARSHGLGVTVREAFAATDGHIDRKVRRRLAGDYRGVTGCSAHAERRRRRGRAPVRYQRWRCHVVIRGARFPRACRAEAFVMGTHRRHVVRIDWLTVSRYCRH